MIWSNGIKALGKWRNGKQWNVNYYDNKGKFIGSVEKGVKLDEKRIKEEQQERERLDRIYKERLARGEARKLKEQEEQKLKEQEEQKLKEQEEQKLKEQREHEEINLPEEKKK